MLPCARVNDYFAARRALIDETLKNIALRAGAPKPLAAPLKRALTSSGKRVRGVLLMAAGEAAGCKPEKLADAAAAMEMIHASSLILDDLPSMDDAQLRRGQPALHREFGEDLAILSSVALLNHAYGLVAKNYAALTPRQWPMLQVIKRVVDAVGWDGTIAGGDAIEKLDRRVAAGQDRPEPPLERRHGERAGDERREHRRPPDRERHPRHQKQEQREQCEAASNQNPHLLGAPEVSQVHRVRCRSVRCYHAPE